MMVQYDNMYHEITLIFSNAYISNEQVDHSLKYGYLHVITNKNSSLLNETKKVCVGCHIY